MDIFTIDALETWMSMSARPPATVAGLDLSAHTLALLECDLANCTFLDCVLNGDLYEHVAATKGSVISHIPSLPFRPRSQLYSVEELYDKYDPADSIESWKRSFDYSNYRFFMDETLQLPRAISTGFALHARLHDTSIEGAVGRFIASQGRKVVGFMGGHDTPRDTAIFKTIAKLARSLALQNRLVLTGGGPGLMEAANLGAFLAPYEPELLDDAIDAIKVAPKYSDPDWLRVAWDWRAKLLKGKPPLDGSTSLGIPTWLYGFEPPNIFATHQAKMFYNSLREDGLVTIANGGLVIGPGNAGTVQEIFQDATQNYYRKPGIAPTPIALLGAAFWDRKPADGPDQTGRTKPLRPLLEALAGEKRGLEWSDAVLITDDVQAIETMILGRAHKAAERTGPTAGDLWQSRHR